MESLGKSNVVTTHEYCGLGSRYDAKRRAEKKRMLSNYRGAVPSLPTRIVIRLLRRHLCTS